MSFDPTQETWEAREEDNANLYLGKTWIAGFGFADALHQNDIARARLASAAPEMARVLLALEWTGVAHEELPACIVCGYLPDLPNPEDGHKPDCALVAALRKAGLR